MKRTQRKLNLTLGLALLAAGSAMLTGCGKEEPPPPPKKKAPPPPPPKPDRVTLASLMQDADARVQFPQDKAPYDRDLAEAVIAFAGAFADGNDLAVSESLDENGRSILDGMLADGTWFETTEKIEAVRVVYLGQDPDEDEEASFAEFVLAVQEADGSYTLGWEASETEGGWVMSSIRTADATLPRASDWDGDSIGAYESSSGWAGATTSSGEPIPAPPEPKKTGFEEYLKLDTPAGKAYVFDVLKAVAKTRSFPFDEATVIAMVAVQEGTDADEITKELTRGRRDLRRRGLDDELIGLGAKAARTAFENMSGQKLDRDVYVTAAAEVLGKDEDEINDLID